MGAQVSTLASSADPSAVARRNGIIGFGAACGFLTFVGTFNDMVQAYKNAKGKNRRKGAAISKNLNEMLHSIFTRACDFREIMTTVALALCLLLRTLGSVWVAKHWGKIVGAIVTRNWERLTHLMTVFAGGTLGLAFLNAYLKYYISILTEHVREKITHWCHERYLRPTEGSNTMVHYKANKVAPIITGCDHRITTDVEKFAELFASVLSQSLKPIVDFLVYSVELSRVQGLATPLTLYGWFACASMISTITLPPFGALAAKEQELSGNFKTSHAELITNCEQIAFLGGEAPEHAVLDDKFRQLYDHCISSINQSFKSEVVRQYLNKYFVTVIGLYLVSRPVRLGLSNFPNFTADMISVYFVSTWKNMEAISTSIQDLFELTNRIGKLSGLASRVHDLMNGLALRPAILVKETQNAPAHNKPKFQHGDFLQFEHVDIHKPDGQLLVKDLNFKIEPGLKVLVTGSNGCGKSSMFRVIRKLWPLVCGTITMPSPEKVYFLTQVNFVPVGTLRDLVIYPMNHEQMKEAGRTDEEVRDCLRRAWVSPEVISSDGRAQLQFTKKTEVDGKEITQVIRPKLHETMSWQVDLSPGQKQKLAFARLFFHRPMFVVLDECTNGISPDVEQDLYRQCSEEFQMAIFSISHKIELKEFHDKELHFKGDLAGSWQYLDCSETIGKILS